MNRFSYPIIMLYASKHNEIVIVLFLTFETARRGDCGMIFAVEKWRGLLAVVGCIWSRSIRECFAKVGSPT